MKIFQIRKVKGKKLKAESMCLTQMVKSAKKNDCKIQQWDECQHQ